MMMRVVVCVCVCTNVCVVCSTLDLHGNQLTGAIPVSISSLWNLRCVRSH